MREPRESEYNVNLEMIRSGIRAREMRMNSKIASKDHSTYIVLGVVCVVGWLGLIAKMAGMF